MRMCVQSKHLLDEALLEKIWRLSADDESFKDWQRQSQTDLGVISSDLTFFWMNWFCTNKSLVPVFDLSFVGKPTEWRTINLEEKAYDTSDTSDTIESRLNSLAARLEQLKQRRS